MKLTDEERELLMNSIDLSISNVSNSVNQMKTVEAKSLARELIGKLLELNKKLSNVQAK